MDSPIIVKAEEILRLGKYRTRWVVGWMVATAALMVATIQTARLYEADRQEARLAELAVQVDEVTQRQQIVADGLLQTLEHQTQTADLLISWGNYVKARMDLATGNLNVPAFATIRAPKAKGKSQ